MIITLIFQNIKTIQLWVYVEIHQSQSFLFV